MGKKLGRGEWPAGHGPNDFKCMGPPATKDGEFEGTKICDMGCFMQEAVDSNKYYHAAIVQSTQNQGWYVYFEYARVGAPKPSIQFVECSSEQDAEREYVKQLKSKNVSRGVWEKHAVLGQRLVPKVDSKGKPKDLYIVRPQATRSTGLPDAKTITSDEGLDQKKIKANGNGKDKKKSTKKKAFDADRQTISLMKDLNVATVKYTKASMADAALPTQSAIDQARAICQEALKQVKALGDDIKDQVNNKELKQLTRDIYGLIPKRKERGAAPETWILSQNNVLLWQQDLDAFESALYTADLGSIEVDDPLGGIPLVNIEWLSPKSERGEFIHSWMPKATRNVHGWVGGMKIKNAWAFERTGDVAKLQKVQQAIAKKRFTCRERALHQPRTRPDLSRDGQKLAVKSNTALMFHGTRSVNVSGIMRESLRLPNQLVGVVITGAMFGPGLYWADDWKKSAGYTSLRGSYWSGGSGGVRGRGAFMFVAEVALGNIHVAPGPRGYTRPPSGHHSVMGKANVSHVANNEYITYERESHLLKYLVEFDA
jgi:hypothetical protein